MAQIKTESISSPNTPRACGSHSQAVKLGDFIFISGQLALDPNTNMLCSDDITNQTRCVLENIKSLLDEKNLDFRHIVKTTIFLTDLNEFETMDSVYKTFFTRPFPASSVVGVNQLLKGSKIEIECIVVDTTPYEQDIKNTKNNSSCGGCCKK
ncbi:MAG: Rid family detoxifying hydrolase [Anaerorhabdus sp.]